MPLSHARRKDDPMEFVSCCYTHRQVQFLHRLVEEGFFTNRSEALRYALTTLVIEFPIIFSKENPETEEIEGGRQLTDWRPPGRMWYLYYANEGSVIHRYLSVLVGK